MDQTQATTDTQLKSGYDFPAMEDRDFIWATRKLTRRPEAIQHLLPKQELMLIAGDPWTGKSVEGLELAYTFGSGGNYHGLPVTQCRAMYITWEGAGENIADRLDKISNRYEREIHLRPIIKLLPEPTHINKAEGNKTMLKLIDKQVQAKEVEVVIFDNFPYTIKGNYSRDPNIMQDWFDGNRWIVRETGITPIYIWVQRKLIFGGSSTEDPFSLDRLKGGSDVAYKANTVIMIGEYKKQKRVTEDGESVSKLVSMGHHIVPKKVKDAKCEIPPLKVKLNHELLSFRGQHWEINGNKIEVVDDLW